MKAASAGQKASVLGAFALQDEARSESRDAIEALHRRGIRVAMITGDSDYQQSKRFNGSAGDTIDMARSRQHLLHAAQRGHGQAQVDLGFIYLNGTGTPKDLAQAFKWFDAAAANQMVLAQCMLGDFYRGGLGGAPQDHAAAVRWYRKTAGASARCASKSQYELYVSYAAGLGVKKDLGKAIEWLALRVARGGPAARAVAGRRA